jgi:hypothetical protein
MPSDNLSGLFSASNIGHLLHWKAGQSVPQYQTKDSLDREIFYLGIIPDSLDDIFRLQELHLR